MKSKTWVFKFFGRSDGSGYMQLSELKFYDSTPTLIDSSAARCWCPDYYTPAASGNTGTEAPFAADLTQWVAMIDRAAGNMLVATFPTAIDAASITFISRSGALTRGTLEVYLYVGTNEVFDMATIQDDLVFVNSFQIYTASTTQQTFSLSLAADTSIPASVPKEVKTLATPGHTRGDSSVFTGVPASVYPSAFLASAYGDGSISGVVTDSVGSVIVGAKIRLILSAKRVFVADTTTDSLGAYIFNNLTRDGTLFDVIADEGSGTFEKKISSKRVPICPSTSLVGDASKGTLGVINLQAKPPKDMLAKKRKGTGGIAILNQTDPFYDKTVLLMSVGASTAVDLSSNALPFTLGTLSIASTNSPPIGTYSIQSTTGTGNFAGFPNIYDRDFTVEYYIRISSSGPSTGSIFCIGSDSLSYGGVDVWWDNSGGKNIFYHGSVNNATQPFDSSANSLSTNTWYHVAWVRHGDTYTLYRDGTQISTQSYRTNPVDLQSTTKQVLFNHFSLSTNFQFAGLRITTAARYTSGFTPPTASDLYG